MHVLQTHTLTDTRLLFGTVSRPSSSTMGGVGRSAFTILCGNTMHTELLQCINMSEKKNKYSVVVQIIQ